MARRIVSLIASVPGTVRPVEPALDANAYAVAEDVDLTVVLRHDAVELAVVGGEVPPSDLAGVPLPPAAAPHEVRALLESGIAVIADAAALHVRGVDAAALVAGVEVADDARIAALLGSADAVLSW